MIRNFTSNIAKKELGKNWADCYIKRFKVHLISRWASAINRVRHQADTPGKYSLYFKLLGKKLEEYQIEP